MDRTHSQPSAPDLNALSLPDLAARFLENGLIRQMLILARDEDLGNPMRDVTGELMFGKRDERRVRMVMREPGVVAGLAFVEEIVDVFTSTREAIGVSLRVHDGDAVDKGTVLLEMSGNARAIVRIERTMLNLVSRMSGIATGTKKYVDLVAGTKARICDTRKTTPGHRLIEKYAVRCGGGTTHRIGLFDAVLIKDNHIAGLSDDELGVKLERAAERARDGGNDLWFVQVEVDRLSQLERVLALPSGLIDMVLLDNMDPETLREAVVMRDRSGKSLLLEASGGVNEKTLRPIAETGVDRISIGGLTHQAVSLDIGLDAV
ncbi:MAG: carboxylating nicotinate-nucleotide diphosphorylase [Phycisphaerales bacterium]|nr:carboxylating nicotinate-nucleotide diphosphorylase [Phycisphaerales bacterium]